MKKAFYAIMVLFSVPIGWLVDKLVRLERPRLLVQFFIRLIFIKKFKVNLTEVEKPLDEYKSFLSFFTRKLTPDARPIERKQDVIISPVDGEIIASGVIDDGNLMQIKNKSYSINDFLPDETPFRELVEIVDPIKSGKFINLYLSPRDYHFIHHPLDAHIKQIFYLPGKFLYPVNHFSLNHFEKVFVRNKRIIVHYQRGDYFFLVAWIGAFNVGKIDVLFDRKFPPNRHGSFQQKKYGNFSVKKADYAGVFELGSSVVMLFPKLVHEDFDFFLPKSRIKMGETLGKVIKNKK